MRFMVIVHPGNKQGYEAGQLPDPQLLANMGKFNEELVNAGVMLDGQGLHPSAKGTRVYFAKGQTTVTDGPFADSLIGGFWIWQAPSKAEALEWAKRAPMEEGATLELRQVFEPEDFGPEVEQQENALLHKMKQQRQ